METIEQLKQDNEKLNARLAKAIEVFKEQKAQIETLIKENEDLKSKLEQEFNTYQRLELECNKSSDALEKKYDELSKQLNEYELKLQNSEAAYEELRKKYTELKSLNDESINAGVELGKENAELQAKIMKLESNSISQEDFDDEVKRLNQTISECKKSYDEKVEDISKLQMQIAKLEKDNQNLIQSSEQYKSAYDEAKSKLKEYDDARKAAEEKAEMWQKNLRSVENTTNEEVKKVTAARDEWIVKYRELENTNNSLQITYNKLKEQCNIIEKDYNNLKENTISLKDYQNECKKLNETILEAKKAYETDLEKLRKLYEDTLLKLQENDKYRQFVEALGTLAESVNITWKTPEKQKSKITVIKQSNSTGSQFMGDAPGMNI